MKFAKILVLTLIGLMWMGQVDAQVSVRRTSRSTEQSGDSKPARSRDAKKSEVKEKAAKGEKARPVTSSADKSGDNPTPKGATPVAAKRTNPAKNRQQQAAVLTEGKTLRQQAFDDYQKDVAEETPWQHIVYRELDLTKDANASLYFPTEPMNGLTSLFRVIMDAFTKGELPAYEYLDGREVFTEKFLVKPKDILDKFEIYYQAKPVQRGSREILEVAESDVPSSEVLSYFVKERWEFDQKHSRYQTRILCICPVLHRSGDFSADAVKYPMFWINYEDLRPFLRDHLVVSQGMNTAARFTMEEYFSLGQYKGDIYKEQNLRGLSLKQQVGDNPDTLRMVQEKLDADLRAFEDSIWIKDPLPEEKPAKKATKVEKSAVKDNTEASQPTGATKKNRRTKETVDLDAAAAEKEEKATTHRSVRR